MAKLRFIGNEPMEVVCNGHRRGGRLGVVEPEQLFEVEDEVFLAHTWPETLWSEVEVPDRERDDSEDDPLGDGLALSQEGQVSRFQPPEDEASAPEPKRTRSPEPVAAESTTTSESDQAAASGRKSRTASEKE